MEKINMVKYTPLKSRYPLDYPMLLLLVVVMVLLIFSSVSFLNVENIRQNETLIYCHQRLKLRKIMLIGKNRLKNNNIDWILPIYQRVTLQNWTYHCLGILIHPMAILTAEECIRPYDSYAAGVFKWEPNYNATFLKENTLYKITTVKGRLSSRLTTFGHLDDKNVKWIDKHTTAGIIIMTINDPINSINPIDISQSLALNDIYNENFVKECVHIIFAEVNETGKYVPKQIQEAIMTRSELFGRINQTFDRLYNSHNKVSIEFNYDANIFGTIDNLKLKSYDTQRGLLGSPLLCRREDDSSSYSLAGLLTSQSHGDWYEYTGINQIKAWIKEKISERK